jgi:hypothetical protein
MGSSVGSGSGGASVGSTASSVSAGGASVGVAAGAHAANTMLAMTSTARIAKNFLLFIFLSLSFDCLLSLS